MDDEKRREKDRLAQARARAKARETGERMGHSLDALLIDALALVLQGRQTGDEVRVQIERGIAQAAWARRVKATPVLARRLRRG